MRIAHFLNGSNVHFEELKRILHRKEMSETYKKNTSFVRASKNSLLEMLDNLLTDRAELSDVISSMMMEDKSPTNGQKEEQHEQTNEARLEPGGPSLEDSHVSTNVTAQIQDMTSQIASVNDFDLNDEGAYSSERFNFSIPERFTKDFNWDVNLETVFGKDLESLIYHRTYSRAVSKYTFQMQMAEQGFHLFEPTFSQIA